MALVLEMRYSKQQILEAYLNEIYLGQDGVRAIHGVGAAARCCFGKDVHGVTLAEAAQLAAMISAPNRTAATRHADAAQQRRDMVLQLMLQQKRITAARAEQASSAEVTVGEHASPALDGQVLSRLCRRDDGPARPGTRRDDLHDARCRTAAGRRTRRRQGY